MIPLTVPYLTNEKISGAFILRKYYLNKVESLNLDGLFLPTHQYSHLK
ncbi:hypothetical protein GF406_04540 [candidate division KSB1 bacterium]|nr:hypothetical protein [candidate division KSB1 bacterium]